MKKINRARTKRKYILLGLRKPLFLTIEEVLFKRKTSMENYLDLKPTPTYMRQVFLLKIADKPREEMEK